jgi:hypothetical protein
MMDRAHDRGGIERMIIMVSACHKRPTSMFAKPLRSKKFRAGRLSAL